MESSKKTKTVGMRFNLAEHAIIQERATANGQGVADYLRGLYYPAPTRLLSLASGEKFTETAIQMALESAEAILDGDGWGDSAAAGDWLGKVEDVLVWLRRNPYHPDTQPKTLAVLEAVPDEVKAEITKRVDGLI